MTITIPKMRLKNTLNLREHWRVKSRRVKREGELVAAFLNKAGRPTILPPCVVTITRVYSGRCKEMDTDGLSASAKKVRDEVARWMNCDDSPKAGIEWRCEQRRGAADEVVIEVGEPTYAPV